jgi:hypothetical protein
VKNLINEISMDIVTPLAVQKLAEDILTPSMEKEAANGLAAFGEALTGSKARRLRSEVGQLSEKVIDASKHPKIQSAMDEVDKIKGALEDSSIHERMKGVKDNLDNAKNNYRSVAKGNDETLNHYTGVRTPLRAVSPAYMGAKFDNFRAKLGVNNAKAQYRAQEGRLKKDLYDDLGIAERKLSDAKKESGIFNADKELRAKQHELGKAESQTRSARTVAGVGAAGAVGGAMYYKKKKDAENATGPYTYGGVNPYEYGGTSYFREASVEEIRIEKIAEEILHSVIQK